MPTNNPTNQRIEALRQAMRTHHIDAYIIPSGDAHLSEYTPERWKSRTWISGFTGSAGTALVTLDKSFMWTDSRYYLQATNELQGSEMTLQRGDDPDTPTIEQYLAAHLSEGAVVGVDGACYSMAEYAPLAQSLANQAGLPVRPHRGGLERQTWCANQYVLPTGCQVLRRAHP